ncbi:MAG: phosphatase PAP2 family protein [Bdellovibrionia bacterium]
MKQDLHTPIHRSFRMTRADFFLTLVPALFWFLTIEARPLWITPRCASQPELCQKQRIPPVDQFSFGFENMSADELSTLSQNLSGALALSLPNLWTLSQWAMARLTPYAAFIQIAQNLVLIVQTTAWNGLLTELSHALSQRPRPFVYLHPEERGKDPSHYVSFYSGHTSFTVAMGVATVLIFLIRGAPYFLVVGSLVGMECLGISTAYLRILAGRHFFSDVLFGAMAGVLVAATVIGLHRAQRKALLSPHPE